MLTPHYLRVLFRFYGQTPRWLDLFRLRSGQNELNFLLPHEVLCWSWYDIVPVTMHSIELSKCTCEPLSNDRYTNVFVFPYKYAPSRLQNKLKYVSAVFAYKCACNKSYRAPSHIRSVWNRYKWRTKVLVPGILCFTKIVWVRTLLLLRTKRLFDNISGCLWNRPKRQRQTNKYKHADSFKVLKLSRGYIIVSIRNIHYAPKTTLNKSYEYYLSINLGNLVLLNAVSIPW